MVRSLTPELTTEAIVILCLMDVTKLLATPLFRAT